MKIESELLSEIMAFCAVSGLSESKLGLDTVKDHKIVARLRKGHEVRSGTINAIRTYIQNYKTPTASAAHDEHR